MRLRARARPQLLAAVRRTRGMHATLSRGRRSHSATSSWRHFATWSRAADVRAHDNLDVSTSTALLILGAFLASAVEMVEALTIVLGVGVVRGWRSTLIGVGAATIVLAALIAALGPALRLVPIVTLRLVVGALLL